MAQSPAQPLPFTLVQANQRQEAQHFLFIPFIRAIANDDLQTFQALIDDPNNDVNVESAMGNSPLLACITNNKQDMLRLLLTREDLEINYVNRTEETALLKAIKDGNIEMVEILLTRSDLNLDQEVLVNSQQIDNFPLKECIINDQLDILRILLAQPGINVNFIDHIGNTPLKYCINNNKIEAFRILIDYPRLDVNLESGLTVDVLVPLVNCLNNNRQEMLQSLLERGANPDYESFTRISPLQLANQNSLTWAIPILTNYSNLRRGLRYADPNYRYPDGHTNYMSVVSTGNSNVAERYYNSSNIDTAPDNNGNTILHHAIASKSLRMLRNCLSKFPDDLDTPNNEGATPLDLALTLRIPQLANVLLEAGARPGVMSLTPRQTQILSTIGQPARANQERMGMERQRQREIEERERRERDEQEREREARGMYRREEDLLDIFDRIEREQREAEREERMQREGMGSGVDFDRERADREVEQADIQASNNDLALRAERSRLQNFLADRTRRLSAQPVSRISSLIPGTNPFTLPSSVQPSISSAAQPELSSQPRQAISSQRLDLTTCNNTDDMITLEPLGETDSLSIDWHQGKPTCYNRQALRDYFRSQAIQYGYDNRTRPVEFVKVQPYFNITTTSMDLIMTSSAAKFTARIVHERVKFGRDNYIVIHELQEA